METSQFINLLDQLLNELVPKLNAKPIQVSFPLVELTNVPIIINLKFPVLPSVESDMEKCKAYANEHNLEISYTGVSLSYYLLTFIKS